MHNYKKNIMRAKKQIIFYQQGYVLILLLLKPTTLLAKIESRRYLKIAK